MDHRHDKAALRAEHEHPGATKSDSRQAHGADHSLSWCLTDNRHSTVALVLTR